MAQPEDTSQLDRHMEGNPQSLYKDFGFHEDQIHSTRDYLAKSKIGIRIPRQYNQLDYSFQTDPSGLELGIMS